MFACSFVVTLLRLQFYKHIPFLFILWVVQFQPSVTQTFHTLCAPLSTRKFYVFLEMLVKMENRAKHVKNDQSHGLSILYDFSGHKPDLEGGIQICFWIFQTSLSVQTVRSQVC